MCAVARFFIAAFFALFVQASGAFAQAGMELLMFERAGCPWCVRWDKEVASIYPKTETGRRIPLRKINLEHQQAPSVQLDLPVRFTPTFVLIDNNKEIGRIVGYMNDATFWGLLDQMVEKSPIRERTSSASEPAP